MSTLSEEYRKVLQETHEAKKKATGGRGWGTTSSGPFYKTIVKLIDRHKVTELLDYGAGAGNLKKSLAKDRPDVVVHEFEPARPEVCARPEPCAFVVCNDVFEHVEPDYLDRFFDDLQRVVLDRAYFTVCMTPAQNVLSDGRNAHLIQKPFEWWTREVSYRFCIREAIHLDRRLPQGQFLVQKQHPLPPYHLN